MPRRNTIRNRVLKEFAEDEAQPKRCRLFRHAFIARARNLSAAGITSNGELLHFLVSRLQQWEIGEKSSHASTTQFEVAR